MPKLNVGDKFTFTREMIDELRKHGWAYRDNDIYKNSEVLARDRRHDTYLLSQGWAPCKYIDPYLPDKEKIETTTRQRYDADWFHKNIAQRPYVRDVAAYDPYLRAIKLQQMRIHHDEVEMQRFLFGDVVINDPDPKSLSTKLKTAMTNLIDKAKLALKNEPYRSCQKAGVTNPDDTLTEEGTKLFLHWLFSKHVEEFKKDMVAPLVKAEEKKQ